MSENERLRSEIKRISKCLHYETDGKLGVIGSLFDAMHIADEALAAKPDVCEWRDSNSAGDDPLYLCACDRKLRHMPIAWEIGEPYNRPADADGICSGCGRKIEVRVISQ